MSRLSRRRFLAGATVLLGTAPILAAAGCAAPATPTAAPKPTEAPKAAAPTTAPAAQPTAAPKPTEAPKAAEAPKPTEAPKAAEAPKPTAAAAPAAGNFKGASFTVLQGTYFVAPGQDLYKKQAATWGQQTGATVSCDFLNWPDLQPKIAAAVQAGGLDVVELWPGWQWLYQDQLLDMSAEAKVVADAGGGFEDYVLNSSPVNGKYLGIPSGTSNGSMLYRMSWFKEVGVEFKSPADQTKEGKWLDLTWDEYHEIGKKLKAKGHPFGQALGHSTGDPPGFTYPYMWAHGAMELEKDGKTIAFNKPEFVDGMKKLIQYWKDAYDTTGLSWDDSANNRAFLAGQISATYNGSSIYTTAKKEQPAIAEDMMHMLIPKGPAGRFYSLGTRHFAILKKSKAVDAAKGFLTWWFGDEPYGEWFRLQEGYFLQHTKKWAKDPMWDKDPKMAPFREQPKYGRDLGYAGPPNDKAALSWSKYIVVDTFAKAVQSGDAEGSIKWGAEELKKIYA